MPTDTSRVPLQCLWRVHKTRMEKVLEALKAAFPDPRITRLKALPHRSGCKISQYPAGA